MRQIKKKKIIVIGMSKFTRKVLRNQMRKNGIFKITDLKQRNKAKKEFTEKFCGLVLFNRGMEGNLNAKN